MKTFLEKGSKKIAWYWTHLLLCLWLQSSAWLLFLVIVNVTFNSVYRLFGSVTLSGGTVELGQKRFSSSKQTGKIDHKSLTVIPENT